ncbi:MAG: 2,5-diketo-D-gluconic acid reductase [Oceanospirillaceae bacterium]|nr:2,5-diketo-D-gluconic acid reductase [Oceanospirillaceae bacterium]MBT10782.1 2,5-diketo-D-gluconic acid reductase [Oceanospirillaceae bacterium]|tara:strand:+ start:1924 stop:2784 length:861 start_codon:yes stop_codon:yes gene_type:complete
MILQETYTLSNGVKIPKIALGTWMITEDAAVQAVKEAINMGYRHIDSAQDYGNEAEVGAGVRESGVSREEIFVTTKLAAQYKTYEGAKVAIEESLQRLDIGYIDMMIIHSPQPWGDFGGTDRYEEGNLEAWRALEEAYEAGKIRAIGLSNFQQSDVENILNGGKVKPAVNQILAHISNTPFDLINFCNDKDILVEAYSPVGHGELFKNGAIAQMAEKYEVSVPQLCIRYDLQLGMLPLPKTANPEHMANNADVDFVISDEDMKTLTNMEKIADYGEADVFPVYREA